MAISDPWSPNGAMMLRSPPCSIAWEGFEGHSHYMQRCGWEFSLIEEPRSVRDPFGGAVRLIFRHRKFGWTGMAQCIQPQHLFEATHLGRGYGADHPVEFQAVTMQQNESRIHLERSMNMPMPTFRRVDMEPALETMRMKRITLRDIFRPFEAEEIIVEPETVAGLLEKIKQLQAPELDEIRARNRSRERYLEEQPVPEFQEVVSAQIITLRRAA